MLVVRQAQLEADEGESEGGIFGAVRDKVRRFLTTVHADNSPTPVDWVFESRSYGQRIRHTTAMTGLLY